MTLVILAAGMGSRYGGLKQLDPMTDAGNFIIDFSIYDAIRAGFDHVVFIIKKENLELFRETIGKRIEDKVKVTYVFQSVEELPEGLKLPEGRTKPWGTGHAVYCARNAVKDAFAVINADDFYGRDAFLQLAKHLSKVPSGDGIAHHCMIGYRLGNTLTENGTVSRGECNVNDDGLLVRVTERTKIEKREHDAAYLDENGVDWNPLSFDTIVSMNCWGFTKEIFTSLEEQFRTFFNTPAKDPLKSEFYLPFAVQEQKDLGLCDVKVYPTSAKWQGVTYAEDKQRVKDEIKKMIQNGEYPENLWNT